MKQVAHFSFLLIFLGCSILSGKESQPFQDPILIEDPIKKQSAKAKEALEVIQGQLQALRDHDVDKAYYAFTSQDFRNATPREAFRHFIYSNSVLARNLSAEFQPASFQNDMIIIQGIFTSSDDNRSIVEYALIPEEGQWKILGTKIFPAPPQ